MKNTATIQIRMQRKIRNNFSGGMIKDSLGSLQPNGTWSGMMNGVIRTDCAINFGVANERGTELFSEIEGDVVGALSLIHI